MCVCLSDEGAVCPPCCLRFGKVPPKVSTHLTTLFTERDLRVSQTTSPH